MLNREAVSGRAGRSFTGSRHKPRSRDPPNSRLSSLACSRGCSAVPGDLLSASFRLHRSSLPAGSNHHRPTLLPPGDEEGELARRRNWARLIARTWLCDPELCSSCGQRLRVVAAISSPAQDHVIEKVLRARGEWAPPWKRPQKTRGPPPVTSQSQGLSDSEGAHFAESWPEESILPTPKTISTHPSGKDGRGETWRPARTASRPHSLPSLHST